jgi:hypothetical protein
MSTEFQLLKFLLNFVYRNYIKKLLNQELKQTDEDIGEITAKLQLNIDEKQKQVISVTVPLKIFWLSLNENINDNVTCILAYI